MKPPIDWRLGMPAGSRYWHSCICRRDLRLGCGVCRSRLVYRRVRPWHEWRPGHRRRVAQRDLPGLPGPLSGSPCSSLRRAVGGACSQPRFRILPGLWFGTLGHGHRVRLLAASPWCGRGWQRRVGRVVGGCRSSTPTGRCRPGQGNAACP